MFFFCVRVEEAVWGQSWVDFNLAHLVVHMIQSFVLNMHSV